MPTVPLLENPETVQWRVSKVSDYLVTVLHKRRICHLLWGAENALSPALPPYLQKPVMLPGWSKEVPSREGTAH